VTDVPDAYEQNRPPEQARASRETSRPRATRATVHLRARRAPFGPRLLARAILLFAAPCFFLAFAAGGRAPASGVPARAALPPAAQGEGGRFSHSLPRHASVACDSCHRREGNEAQPRLPGHKACIDCHVAQFTSPQSPLCTNCHTNVESNNPPLKPFPGLTNFGMRFDHAQHMSGAAHPAQHCAACHQPARRGVALSIPAGLSAHNNCYQCHTPDAQAAGRNIGSCGVCHALGGYGRVSTASPAYRVNFSHAGHGPRQGLRCDDCHQVRSGVPRTQQVTAPRPAQHFASGRAQSCMTCHNDRRAFGGDNFADCKRCHTGQTFRF
jgi:c(7)-type cytochrome triheme protein